MALINLRNALMSGKRTPTAKDYVQDGQVLRWDGIENAGYGTHDAYPSNWIDLVEGKTISLPALTQIFDNRVVFLNSAESATITYEDDHPVYSVFHTYKLTNQDQTSRAIFRLLDPMGTSASAGAYSYNNNTPLRVFRGINWHDISLSDYTAPCQIGIVYSIGSSSSAETNIYAIYINGLEVYKISGPSWWFGYAFSTTGNLTIGGSSNMQQSVFASSLYSRALTAAEIAANYAIDKARFGLP